MYRYVAGFLIILGLFSCENDMTEVAQYFPKEATQLEEARDVEIYYSDSAIVRVIVKGPLLYNYISGNSPRSEFVEGLSADFYDVNHIRQSRLTAKFGVRYLNENSILVQDSVVVVTIRNEKLETEELIWDEKTGTVETDKFVKITTPDEVIHGYGLKAKDDFSYWKIKAVTGRMHAADMAKDF